MSLLSSTQPTPLQVVHKLCGAFPDQFRLDHEARLGKGLWRAAPLEASHVPI